MIKPQRKVLVLSFIVSPTSFELFNNVFNNVMDTIGDYYIEIINTTDYKDYKEVVVRAIEEDGCLYLEAMADFFTKECNTNTQAAWLNELSKPKTPNVKIKEQPVSKLKYKIGDTILITKQKHKHYMCYGTVVAVDQASAELPYQVKVFLEHPLGSAVIMWVSEDAIRHYDPKSFGSLNRDTQPDRDWLLDEDKKATENLKSKSTSASGQAQDTVKTTIPRPLSFNQSLKELEELGSMLALSWLNELFKK